MTNLWMQVQIPCQTTGTSSNFRKPKTPTSRLRGEITERRALTVHVLPQFGAFGPASKVSDPTNQDSAVTRGTLVDFGRRSHST